MIDILMNPWFLVVWGAAAMVSSALLIRDLVVNNAQLMSLMKLVWVLTVLYSGPLGLTVYWATGRRQIRDDALWRRAFRSVAHCYSGCGLGEVTGVAVAAGLMGLGTTGIALTTFAFAFLMGFGLTLGPLIQDGVPFAQALRETLIAETPSIAVMEIVAIGVDLMLADKAAMGDVLFWSSLIVSLSCGLIAAYPVNWLLIQRGIKQGMMDPRQTM
ncbi:DUF4396 domain-containing protein [Hoeflea olei]|uniref:Copper oxidase n=1 Tax=Hoeflea olei TaxID=1480615 RepID=A0A1C1YVF5_9HYPH|nr:DUF4396 domain-containing protein [Hoeflea olei]OCW57512.1 copper oxidase [Hoeflea olei]